MSNDSAVPGSMNMLLWYVVIDGIARDAAALCSGDAPQHLAPSSAFAAAVAAACTQADATTLGRLWDMTLRGDAPATEQAAWLALHLDPEAPRDPETVVHEALLTALYRAEFLAGY